MFGENGKRLPLSMAHTLFCQQWVEYIHQYCSQQCTKDNRSTVTCCSCIVLDNKDSVMSRWVLREYSLSERECH